ncbi:MAG: hypothetical protein ACREDY_08255, partial [Bradyrhizobium sp.]
VDSSTSARDDSARLTTDLVGSVRPVIPAGTSLPTRSSNVPVDRPAPSAAEKSSSPISHVVVADVPIPAARPTSLTDQARGPSETPAADATVSVATASDARADDAESDAKKADIIGVWAPNAGTCSARDFRQGALPAVISADGAWAGETFCMFSSKKQTDAGWSVVAKCASPKERWTARVQLTVKDNRLKWTSRRGTQLYTRCSSDVLMAEAR